MGLSGFIGHILLLLGGLGFTLTAAPEEVLSIVTVGLEAQKHRLLYVCAYMVPSTFFQKQILFWGELCPELTPELKCRAHSLRPQTAQVYVAASHGGWELWALPGLRAFSLSCSVRQMQLCWVQLWLVGLPEDCSSPACYTAQPAQGSVCCTPLQGQFIPLILRARVRASPCGASSFALSDSQGAFTFLSDMRHLKPLLSLKLQTHFS